MEFELTMFVVISTNYIGSCKSNYRAITTMTAHFSNKTVDPDRISNKMLIEVKYEIAGPLCLQLTSGRERENFQRVGIFNILSRYLNVVTNVPCPIIDLLLLCLVI
jgi:hypothetical protein